MCMCLCICIGIGILYIYVYIHIYIYIYTLIVNKPPLVAGILEDNILLRLKDCLKNEQVAEKQSFEHNCEILRSIFQPRALYPLIHQRAVNSFYNPLINFSRQMDIHGLFLHILWFLSCFLVQNCQPAFEFLGHWLLQKGFICFP